MLTAEIEDAEMIARILAEVFPALDEMSFGLVTKQKNVEILTTLFHAGHLVLDETRIWVRDDPITALAILNVEDPSCCGQVRDYASLLKQYLNLVPALRAFLKGRSATLTLVGRMPHGPLYRGSARSLR